MADDWFDWFLRVLLVACLVLIGVGIYASVQDASKRAERIEAKKCWQVGSRVDRFGKYGEFANTIRVYRCPDGSMEEL